MPSRSNSGDSGIIPALYGFAIWIWVELFLTVQMGKHFSKCAFFIAG
jgi:hypothetical protein